MTGDPAAEAIHAAMTQADVDVEYFSYRGQGHSFAGDAWTLFLERIKAFYDDALAAESAS